MLTRCRGFSEELVSQWRHANIERLEAECGQELPELSDATLKQRAQRLIDLPISYDDDDDDFLLDMVE
jgi:hypothetical protein